MYNLDEFLFNTINITWYDEEDDTNLEDILLRDRWETGYLRL